MKKVTSVTMHMTSAGQRLSYTYTEVNEDTGAVVSENNRSSMVVLDIEKNKEILASINAVMDYVSDRLSE